MESSSYLPQGMQAAESFTVAEAVDFYQERTGGRRNPLKGASPHEQIVMVNCPITERHEGGVDRNPSCWVNTQSGRWGCFACGSGGDEKALQKAFEAKLGEQLPNLTADMDGMNEPRAQPGVERSTGGAVKRNAPVDSPWMRRMYQRHFYRDEEGMPYFVALRKRERKPGDPKVVLAHSQDGGCDMVLGAGRYAARCCIDANYYRPCRKPP